MKKNYYLRFIANSCLETMSAMYQCNIARMGQDVAVKDVFFQSGAQSIKSVFIDWETFLIFLENSDVICLFFVFWLFFFSVLRYHAFSRFLLHKAVSNCAFCSGIRFRFVSYYWTENF